MAVGLRELLPGRRRNSPAREKIHATIQANPGVHKGDLQRMTGESWGNLTHHIFMLSRRKRIRCHYHGNRLLLFPARVEEQDFAPLAALRRRLACQVLAELSANAPQGVTDLARRLGTTRHVLTRTLAHLEEAGLVNRDNARRAPYRVHEATAARIRHHVASHESNIEDLHGTKR